MILSFFNQPISTFRWRIVILTPILLAATIISSSQQVEATFLIQPQVNNQTEVRPFPPIKKKVASVVKKPPKSYAKPPLEEPNQLFDKYSQAYNVDADLLRKIAKCESGYNPGAQNGPYGGMYQFHPGTWASVRKRMGESTDTNTRYIAEEAIKTAAFKISQDGAGAWPVCGRA